VFRRLWEKLKLLYLLAKSERATPREIGWAVAIGAFAGCTPAVGVHGPLAMGLATLARKNRLFAWLGSRISNMVFLPFIALAEVQLSHRIRTGAFIDLSRENILAQAPHLLLDWCLGTFPVGAVVGIVMGLSAYAFAHRRDARKTKTEAATTTTSPPADANADIATTTDANGTDAARSPTRPTPAELPPPSSGSPA
jgi:uncharacterized protein (DUF2062 family)